MQSGLPVLVLVGRPNVGKSTLFNRLTGTRDALVADYAGLTRDRQYGRGVFEDKAFIVVDTGGLMPESADPLAALAEEQAQMALEEADHIFFLTDAPAGRHSSDEAIASKLRKLGKPITLLVNKTEGRARGNDRGTMVADFYALGLGEPQPVSAEYGDGIVSVMRSVMGKFPANDATLPDIEGEVRVAIVGRPNVGKSTLVNRLIGEERVVAADKPGTTRDAIRVPFEYEGNAYTLIDTAGIRRRSRVEEVIEKFSIIKTLQAIENAHVVIVVVDAHADIGEQDARLMGLVAQRGRAMILAVNKWDGLDSGDREQAKYQVGLKMPFLDFTPVHYISARHGSGVGVVMRDVKVAYESTMKDLPTPELTRILERSVDRHAPPAVLGRRIKLRYAHQGGMNPPVIVIHGSALEHIADSYRRFLERSFLETFKLQGTPLRVQFRTAHNPFAAREK